MTSRAIFVCILFSLLLNCSATALQDDVATVGLWHMESIYYDASDLPWTEDDDSQNPGRNHDMILFRSGLNETPPTVVPGYIGNAFQFDGGQIMICSPFWASGYTELKLDFMINIAALPTELGAAITYLFDKPSGYIFELNIWPGTGGADYMRFRVHTSTGATVDGDIVVAGLKNRWLRVVGSYDASWNYLFSITDTTTGITTTVTKTGPAGLRSVSTGDISFGSTSPLTGSKPTNRNFRGMVDEMKISNKVVTPHYAYRPSPAAGTTITAAPASLGWSKGLVANGSDVFFGTSSSAVAAAVKPPFDLDGSTFIDFGDFAVLGGQWQQAPVYPSADINGSGLVNGADLLSLISNWLTSTSGAYPLYIGSTTGNSIGCPPLLPSTTYYWRVDSVNISENTVGNIWSFTTGNASATGPTPSDDSTNVVVDANTVTLKWTSGFGATEHQVYFGTASNPPFLTTVFEAQLAVNGLAPGTKYYWRVDSVRASGTTTGPIWDFTTGTIDVVAPSPSSGATDVKYPLGGIDLSWSCVFAPEHYEVYFGTTNPPQYLTSTTNPYLRSPDITQNTTYYWRVDCVSVFGTVTGATWSFTTSVPAFPEAHGFGRFAKGGRGGDVYHVTKLTDDGSAGTLRYGITNAPSSGRTIVFDVGGYITLSSRLSITKNRITIAGQTAPGGGIGIAGGGLSIGNGSDSFNDIVVRYVRVRYTSSSGNDAITVNKYVSNLILDHVSASWGTDEVCSVTGATNVTIQWCMITEGVNLLGHSKGSLLEWPVLSLHHSIYAHNDDRNPKSKGVFDFRNNVVYNWGFDPYIAGDSAGMSYANVVGNYYIAGASSTTAAGIMITRGNSNYHMYLSDNRIDSNRNGVKDGVDLGTGLIDPARPLTVMSVPYQYPPVTTTAPEAAYTQVLANAGCSVLARGSIRDSIDTRIVNDIINETGWIITNYTDRGGLGTIAGGTAPTDTDQDGMPDSWEIANGLDKNNAADRNGDLDGDGYTNLEEYLNSLTVYP